MLIDTHCHFNSLSRNLREELLSQGLGNYSLIDSGIDRASSLASVSFSKQYDFIYTSLGFHPFCAKKFRLEILAEYEKLIEENKRIVSIGEIGLDYKADSALEEQEDVLRHFIQLARTNNLPVVIHNRLNNFRVIDILDEFYQNYENVVFHCFSYSGEFLEKILKRGGFVSFSLNVLRKNKEITSSLKRCPLENMLLETDSPYMKIKGNSSTPLDIDKVYSQVASIKGIEQKQLEGTVFSNAQRLFSFKIKTKK